jgi:hypothetical protein
MPHVSTRATLDVRPGSEMYSSLHRRAGTGVLKSIAQTRTGLTNTTPTNIVLKNTALRSIGRTSTDPTTREHETASLRWKEGTELSFRKVQRTCWTN